MIMIIDFRVILYNQYHAEVPHGSTDPACNLVLYDYMVHSPLTNRPSANRVLSRNTRHVGYCTVLPRSTIQSVPSGPVMNVSFVPSFKKDKRQGKLLFLPTLRFPIILKKMG